MFVTVFTDLPDLAILDILRYLSPFDAIQAFYDIVGNADRIINLLIEARCFSSIHHLRLPLFNFVCDHVLPRMGSKLSHLTLYDHQLTLARDKQILSYLINLSSLHLINIIDIIEHDNALSYFLHEQLQSLTVKFISEHHIEAQAYMCEQFIFNQKSQNLISCQLLNTYGIQLRHLTLFPNSSIEQMTVQLKQLSDLHILFDHLVTIKILNVELCRWTVEEIKYDYRKLPTKLPYLSEFSLHTQHALSFEQMTTMIRYLIHLRKLSFVYRNYDERGIDINQLQLTLTHLNHLKQLHFVIKFIYFSLNPKLTFENNLLFKQQWNIHTYINPLYKYYLAYTQPFIHRTYSMSSDVLFEDDSIYFPSITNLSLITHAKQLTLVPVIRLLNSHFPSLTHLHIVDSFGIEDKDGCSIKLPNIHSFDASELKISNSFRILFQSMPNIIDLHIHSNILTDCPKSLLVKNQIKHLQLITSHFDQINDILAHFPSLEQLTVNHKKHSSQCERKFCRIVWKWFEICSRLYTIHVKAAKLSDLFYLVQMESTESIRVQYWNEILTLWK